MHQRRDPISCQSLSPYGGYRTETDEGDASARTVSRQEPLVVGENSAICMGMLVLRTDGTREYIDDADDADRPADPETRNDDADGPRHRLVIGTESDVPRLPPTAKDSPCAFHRPIVQRPPHMYMHPSLRLHENLTAKRKESAYRMLEMSHMLWETILPTVYPLAMDVGPGSAYPHAPAWPFGLRQLGDREFALPDDRPQNDSAEPPEWASAIALVGEVFFPTQARADSVLVRRLGEGRALLVAAEYECMNVANRIGRRLPVNCIYTAPERFVTVSALPSEQLAKVVALPDTYDAAQQVKEVRDRRIMTSCRAVAYAIFRCVRSNKRGAADAMWHAFMPEMRSISDLTPQYFIGACNAGNFKAAKWIASRFGIVTPTMIDHEFRQRSFAGVAENGSVEFLAWLVRVLFLEQNDLVDAEKHGTTSGTSAFVKACVADRRDNADWLIVNMCNLSPGLAGANPLMVQVVAAAFCMCARRGMLSTMNWLVTRLWLDSRIFRTSARGAFLEACEAGHMDVVQMLAGKFDLTASFVRSGSYSGFRAACVHGHMDIADWFAHKYGFDPISKMVAKKGAIRPPTIAIAGRIRALLNAMRECESNANGEAVTWLRTRFPILCEDETVIRSALENASSVAKTAESGESAHSPTKRSSQAKDADPRSWKRKRVESSFRGEFGDGTDGTTFHPADRGGDGDPEGGEGDQQNPSEQRHSMW